MSVLSLVPMPWRVAIGLGALLSFGMVGGFAAWKGYSAGYDKAEALGRAAIAELRSEHDKTYAEAMANLNIKLREQTRRAMAASNELETERKNNEKIHAGLRAQIGAITANSNHVFSADFVRVWNEATGASRGDPVPGAGNTPGAAGTSRAGEAPGAGLLEAGAVGEADVLAYVIYYGKRCRNLEAQVNAWIDLFDKGEE